MEVDVEESEEHPLCVGHELVDEYRTNSEECQQRRMCQLLTNEEINQIQECLMKIVRPSWHRGVPANLSNAKHSKLKAEQWRSGIEFDLPVILYKLWATDSIGDETSK